MTPFELGLSIIGTSAREILYNKRRRFLRKIFTRKKIKMNLNQNTVVARTAKPAPAFQAVTRFAVPIFPREKLALLRSTGCGLTRSLALPYPRSDGGTGSVDSLLIFNYVSFRLSLIPSKKHLETKRSI